MNVDKKLAIFTQITMRQVEEKRNQMAKEIDKAFKEAVDESVRTARKQAKERIRKEQYTLEQTRNNEIVTASLSVKRKQIALRERLTDELFADVAADIKAFTETPAYEAFLINSLRASCAAAPGRYAFVRLTAQDKRLQPPITAATGLTTEITDEDFWGGYKLISADRRIINDQTFKRRLDEERINFSMMSSQDI